MIIGHACWVYGFTPLPSSAYAERPTSAEYQGKLELENSRAKNDGSPHPASDRLLRMSVIVLPPAAR